MKKRKEPVVPETEQEFELSQESFSEEEDFVVVEKNESDEPEEQPKKKFKVVLVSSSYVVYDFNGTNSFIEKSKIDNKNPHIGDFIEI